MPIVTSTFATCPTGNVEDGNCVTGGQTTVNVNVLPILGLWLSSGTGSDTTFAECSYYSSTSAGGTIAPVTQNSSGTTTCSNPTGSSAQNRALTFSVLPGQTSMATMNARVMTNVDSGYKLYIEMKDATTDLVNNNATTQFTKSGGTIASPKATLDAGTWGVKGGDVTSGFIGVPASGSGSTAGVLRITSSKTTVTDDDSDYTSGSETTEITFGARATTDMMSGTYTGTVVITAVVTD